MATTDKLTYDSTNKKRSKSVTQKSLKNTYNFSTKGKYNDSDIDLTVNVDLASLTPGTATASDIVSGKTAIVNGENIEGTLKQATSLTAAVNDVNTQFSISTLSNPTKNANALVYAAAYMSELNAGGTQKVDRAYIDSNRLPFIRANVRTTIEDILNEICLTTNNIANGKKILYGADNGKFLKPIVNYSSGFYIRITEVEKNLTYNSSDNTFSFIDGGSKSIGELSQFGLGRNLRYVLYNTSNGESNFQIVNWGFDENNVYYENIISSLDDINKIMSLMSIRNIMMISGSVCDEQYSSSVYTTSSAMITATFNDSYQYNNTYFWPIQLCWSGIDSEDLLSGSEVSYGLSFYILSYGEFRLFPLNFGKNEIAFSDYNNPTIDEFENLGVLSHGILLKKALKALSGPYTETIGFSKTKYILNTTCDYITNSENDGSIVVWAKKDPSDYNPSNTKEPIEFFHWGIYNNQLCLIFMNFIEVLSHTSYSNIIINDLINHLDDGTSIANLSIFIHHNNIGKIFSSNIEEFDNSFDACLLGVVVANDTSDFSIDLDQRTSLKEDYDIYINNFRIINNDCIMITLHMTLQNFLIGTAASSYAVVFSNAYYNDPVNDILNYALFSEAGISNPEDVFITIGVDISYTEEED